MGSFRTQQAPNCPVKKLNVCMGTEGWLPFSQEPATDLSEPDKSFHTLQTYFFKSYFTIIIPSWPMFSKRLGFSG